MKGGCVAGLPVLCVVSLFCVLASPFCLRGGPVEWRGVAVCVVPVFGLGPPLHIVSSLLYCLSSPLPPSSTVCVLCRSIVGLVLCLCGRVVLLWNSGGGCVVREGVGGLLFTVNSLCVVVCVSVWCVCCLVVMCCGLWNGGGVRV